MSNNPYHHLEIDPFAVAHKLGMPACLFEAFKKAMLGGKRGHKDTLTDYQQAIDCLTRYQKDINEGLLDHYIAPLTNKHFLDEVEKVYGDYVQSHIYQSTSDEVASMLIHAHLAGMEMLSLYHPEKSQKKVHRIIDNAISHLNAALSYAIYQPNEATA